MPAPSLVDTCTRACVRNVRNLTDVGTFEYWKIKTVLARITSAEQLHTIEINSPQICGEDAELWQALIARDIPNWQNKGYVPKNPLKWYEVYCKYKKEQRQEIERDEEALRKTMMGLQEHRQSHVSKVVDHKKLPKLPRDPYMMPNNGGVPLTKNRWGKKEATGNMTWTSGSKTKLTDGKSVLMRARREAKEIGTMNRLNRPSHLLSGRMGQVKKAPAGMSKEYQIAAQPALKILSHRKVLSKEDISSNRPSLQDREAKLRAAMSSKKHTSGCAKETLVGSSDEDSGGDGEGDDLFDEPEVKPRQATRPLAQPRGMARPPASSSPQKPQQSSSPPGIAKPRVSGPSSTTIPSSSRPTMAGPAPAKPKFIKKRAPVDVFNRGAAKKPRI